jgi:glycosyltransferase involved in cell wall biosynthesis
VTTAEAATGPRDRAAAIELVSVGRFVPQKRLDHLLDLAETLRGRGLDLRMRLVGTGPLAQRLAKEVAERGMSHAVVLTGFVCEDEKAAILAAADLHLSASRGEGWGLAVLEAAALGVPTVAYDVEGLRDSVRHGVTGWLVGEGESLDAVVEKALGELADSVRRAEVAATCRQWAAGFRWDSTADRMAEILLAAMGPRQPR